MSAQEIEKIADKMMLQCQNGKDYECPYLATCKHEDTEYCRWQLEKAAEIYQLVVSSLAGEEMPRNPYKIQAQIHLQAGDNSGYCLYDAMGLGFDTAIAACAPKFAALKELLGEANEQAAGREGIL